MTSEVSSGEVSYVAHCMYKNEKGRCTRPATEALNVYDSPDGYYDKEHPIHLEFCSEHRAKLFPRYPEEQGYGLSVTDMERWKRSVEA